MMFKLRHIAAAVGLVCAPTLAHASEPQTITVYSARIEELLKPTLDRYTKETGVKINLLTDRSGSLNERLAAEGESSPADVLITVDVGGLWSAGERGLLQKVNSPTLDKNVPAHFRDPNGRWWGLSERARTIFYSPQRVNPKQLSTYEDLADPKWKGKLCLRTGKQAYTQSLVAMLIAQHGIPKTEQIVKGWVANLAGSVYTNDRSMLAAIAAGQCDVALANSYYYGREQAKDPNYAKSVALFWANQGANQGGTHVNLSGAGIPKYAKNPEGGRKLLEWLSSAKEQTAYTHGTFEAPVNPKAEPDAIVKAWGKFKPNTINASKVGSYQAEAIRLLDRVGYR